jgi:hypothetical protein
MAMEFNGVEVQQKGTGQFLNINLLPGQEKLWFDSAIGASERQ